MFFDVVVLVYVVQKRSNLYLCLLLAGSPGCLKQDIDIFETPGGFPKVTKESKRSSVRNLRYFFRIKETSKSQKQKTLQEMLLSEYILQNHPKMAAGRQIPAQLAASRSRAPRNCFETTRPNLFCPMNPI